MKRTLLSSPTSRLPIDLMIFLAIESSEAKVLTSEQILQWIEANIYQSAKSAFDHSTWTQMVLKQLVYNRSFYLKRSESVSRLQLLQLFYRSPTIFIGLFYTIVCLKFGLSCEYKQTDKENIIFE